MGNVVLIGLARRDQSLAPQRGQDRPCRFVDVEASELLAGSLGHAPVLADHRDLLETVPAPDLEVVRIVTGCDLERARAEVRVDVLVGDDLEPASDERQDGVLADQA